MRPIALTDATAPSSFHCVHYFVEQQPFQIHHQACSSRYYHRLNISKRMVGLILAGVGPPAVFEQCSGRSVRDACNHPPRHRVEPFSGFVLAFSCRFSSFGCSACFLGPVRNHISRSGRPCLRNVRRVGTDTRTPSHRRTDRRSGRSTRRCFPRKSVRLAGRYPHRRCRFALRVQAGSPVRPPDPQKPEPGSGDRLNL